MTGIRNLKKKEWSQDMGPQLVFLSSSNPEMVLILFKQ